MKNINKLSDEEVVKEILSGDKELFSEIVNRYEKKLSRYVLRITTKKGVLDDIMQNVFVKTYKNLNSFDKNLKFSTWIYRITHNETLNFVNSGFLKKFVSINFFYNLTGEGLDEEIIDRKDSIEKIKIYIDKLELKYKEPLYLYYFEEKNYNEISDILRIPVKTVGTLIHRAKLKIRENIL